MQGQTRVDPWWAALTVWAVVNAVNVLQAVGFLSRIATGSRAINRVLGYAIVALAVPAALALVALARASWLAALGRPSGLPRLYRVHGCGGVCLARRVPLSRALRRPGALSRPLFGSIFLMGLPMFRLNRSLWLVTVATTTFLLVSMVLAIRKGVG